MRILEFGPYSLLARTQPGSTVRFWTGGKPEDSLGEAPPPWGPRRLRELHLALKHGNFDGVACHVPIAPLFAFNPLRLAYETILRHRGAPLVALDFNDREPLTPTAMRVLDRCCVYFKRELPIDRSKLLPDASLQAKQLLERNTKKLRPVSLSLAPWRIADMPDPLPPKTIDLFFGGSINSNVRRRGLDLLSRCTAPDLCIDIATDRLDRATYLNRLAQAHITWSPEGLGWQCFRHLEAAAAESVPLINNPHIEIPDPLIPGKHCLHYNPDDESLIRVLRDALTDKNRLRQMAQSARRHVLQHHLHATVAQQILNSIPTLSRDRDAI